MGKKILSFIGWVFMVLAIFILAVAALSFYNSRKTGEPTTIFGYRPVYVLTGSMEPYMREHSIVITKELTAKDKVNIGDVITFHVTDTDGTKLVVTHRINAINADGTYTTKGDNNNVTDSIPITKDNMEARVIFVMNWVASLVALWATARGKFIIFSAIGVVILLIVGLRIFFGKGQTEVDDETASSGVLSEKAADDKPADGEQADSKLEPEK